MIYDLSKIEEIYHTLKTTKCDELYLKSIIDYVDVKTIYCNQLISDNFIRDYILIPEYHTCDEDSYITYEHVKYFGLRPP